jgi:hypothetical protein
LAIVFFRLVDPNATSFDRVSEFNSVLALLKNSASLGLDPGQPASMKSTLKVESLDAILSLSSQDTETDSPCVPS